MTGDKEVEDQDGEATANVIPEMSITDLTWDLKDPYIEIDYKSSGVPQVPMAASMPVSMLTEETLYPVSLSLEEPQREIPAAEPVMIDDLIPDYLDVPLVGFSRPELHQVIPWVCFEAQNMCEPLWWTEL